MLDSRLVEEINVLYVPSHAFSAGTINKEIIYTPRQRTLAYNTAALAHKQILVTPNYLTKHRGVARTRAAIV